MIKVVHMVAQILDDCERIIYNIFPDLKEIVWNTQSQNNFIAFVDEEWVFRFPKYEKPARELVKEVNFFNTYGDVLNINVPTPVRSNLQSDNGQMYSLYRRIEGVPLSDVRGNLPDKQALAHDLAHVLNKLHKIPIDQQLESILGLPEDPLAEWANLSKRIKKLLYPHMRLTAVNEVEQLFSHLLNSLSKVTFKPTVIHGDFGMSNIIINPLHGGIAGIIDFGSVVISDPAYDIASLLAVGNHGMGEEFILLMADVYTDFNAQLERAKLYVKTFALQEALFGAENNDKKAFEAGMKDYI